MKRLLLGSGLFLGMGLLVACSSGDGGGQGTGGQSAGGTSSQAGSGGTTNGNAGTSSGNAGNNTGGSSGDTGGGGAGNNGGSGNNGGAAPGGAGGVGGQSAGGAGGQGGTTAIPSTCGMPVPNQNPGNTCYNAPPPALTLTEIVPNGQINAPMLLASPPGDTERLFVVSRSGTIRIIKNGTLLPEPFLDITELTTNNNGENEHGLLGLAFDPGFAQNGTVWIHYNVDAQPLESLTASVKVSANNPDQADIATLQTLFTVDQPADNHNGGMIAFGNDGCLYVSFGDGGNQNDPDGNGQNTDEPLGSILRVDPATGMGALGNPGYGDGRIWNYGLRNPWRFSFDAMSMDLYIGDVGQGTWEEVDIAPAGVGDFNFGWKVAEGPDGDQTGKRHPAVSHGRDDGQSVTGGYVYRGTAIPDMVGRYVYGDFKSSRYWVLTYSGENAGQPEICDEYEITTDLDDANGPTAFGQDANGELYVLTLSGAIYRIDAQ